MYVEMENTKENERQRNYYSHSSMQNRSSL